MDAGQTIAGVAPMMSLVGAGLLLLVGPHAIPFLLTVALTGGSIVTGLN